MSENAKNKSSPDASDLPNINFMYKTMLARDPSKRRVKPTPTVELIPLTLESESEDSDFKLDDDDSATDSSSGSDDDSDDDSSEDEEEEEESKESKLKSSVNGAAAQDGAVASTSKTSSPPYECKSSNYQLPPGIPPVRVCCICLGTHSSDANEVVECDSCGILVHEGCYGVTESGSVSSTQSSCSTEPWFCEPCQGNVINPPCQLCPNLGGALKETDTGLWVHLVCALYTPGIAFGELDKLTQVTLFEMPYNRWGAKACSLCEDPWLSRTGVCIGCDAGMCRSYFHVTCAQREGLLSETFHEETVQADPFYANCKMHTEKSTMKRRRQNFLAHQRTLHLWTQKRNANQEMLTSGQSEDVSLRRILRKLDRQRNKFQTKHWPRATWVPTQKMPRLLTTSASAVRRLRDKAVLMGVDVEGEEIQEAQSTALADVHKKWHLPPAFSVEFIAYVLDRERRITTLKEQTSTMKVEAKELDESEKQWRSRYESLIEEQSLLKSREATYRTQLGTLHQILAAVAPKRSFSMPVSPRRSGGAGGDPSSEPSGSSARRSSRSPPAKVRLNRDSMESIPSQTDTSNQSSMDFWVADIQGASNRVTNNVVQEGHPIPSCSKDLSPRMVLSLKRVTKSGPPAHLLSKQKKLRLDEKPLRSMESMAVALKSFPTALDPHHHHNHHQQPFAQSATASATPLSSRAERHNATTTATLTPRANGTHHSNPPNAQMVGEVPKLTIKLKPFQPSKVSQSGFPFIFANSDSDHSQSVRSRSPSASRPSERLPLSSIVESTLQTPEVLNICSVCSLSGPKNNTVSCDECLKVFHFKCLDPPLRKTPKQRGYSWHCADCDSSDDDSN